MDYTLQQNDDEISEITGSSSTNICKEWIVVVRWSWVMVWHFDRCAKMVTEPQYNDDGSADDPE